MSAGTSHHVHLLLPKETGIGQPISKEWFDDFRQELTEKFGRRDKLLARFGSGIWQSGGGTEKDCIAVVEIW